jgi:hypothetical protein
MIVAQLVNSTTSRPIPINAPAIFAGQCISRANLPIANSALPGNSILGVVQSDLPVFVAGPQPNSIQYNAPRTVNVATNGRLALRVYAGQFSSIAVGGNIGIYFGDVVTSGFVGAPAVTLNGDLLVVDEKVMGADGFGYVLVYFN